MASPQTDQYDSRMVLYLAETGTSPLRDKPYKRLPVASPFTLCDGAVAVCPAPAGGLPEIRYDPASPDHPNLALAAEYLRRWPEGYLQFQMLIDTIYPYADRNLRNVSSQECLGSSSHSYEQDFGKILVSVDSALGLAQAFVHEMAHHKLRAMGISLEQADRLITNPPEPLFASPVRQDCQRPMTAVFHAQYSFIHVTALDLYMLRGERDPQTRQFILMLLKRNTIRMQAGYGTIEDNVQTDAAGSSFVAAFMEWSLDILNEAESVLDSTGYGIL